MENITARQKKSANIDIMQMFKYFKTIKKTQMTKEQANDRKKEQTQTQAQAFNFIQKSRFKRGTDRRTE